MVCLYTVLSYTTLRDTTADARKVYESLHFLSECYWYELTSADCPDRMEPYLN